MIKNIRHILEPQSLDICLSIDPVLKKITWERNWLYHNEFQMNSTFFPSYHLLYLVSGTNYVHPSPGILCPAWQPLSFQKAYLGKLAFALSFHWLPSRIFLSASNTWPAWCLPNSVISSHITPCLTLCTELQWPSQDADHRLPPRWALSSSQACPGSLRWFLLILQIMPGE